MTTYLVLLLCMSLAASSVIKHKRDGGGTPTGSACTDTLPNCASYGTAMCTKPDYANWIANNCARFCNKCGGCVYNGTTYQQGQQWKDGCLYNCSCEDAMSGRYRCYDLCPTYSSIPLQCPLVKAPGECCAKPQCHFDTHGTSGTGGGTGPMTGGGTYTETECTDTLPNCASYGAAMCTKPDYANWIANSCARFCNKCGGCKYKGTTYQQGQNWKHGCQYNCVCEDAMSGRYKCTDLCPTYSHMPPPCLLVKAPGECCAQPRCDFDTPGTSGSGGGTGIMTGGGTCTDTLITCADFGTSMCTDPQYSEWVNIHCRKFCNRCSGTTGSGTCVDTLITCADIGTSMCTNTQSSEWVDIRCRKFCNRCSGTTGSGMCVDTIITCADYGTSMCTDPQYSLWVNIHCRKFCNRCSGTTGSGCTDSLPNCASYGTAMCTKPDYANWIANNCARFCNKCGGCVYNGTTYQQGQKWKHGCQYNCVCEDAMSGRYRCYELCPTYSAVPPQCSLVRAPGECCAKPQCHFDTHGSSRTGAGNRNLTGRGTYD